MSLVLEVCCSELSPDANGGANLLRLTQFHEDYIIRDDTFFNSVQIDFVYISNHNLKK
jgi:hypothetical protein